MLGRRVVCRTSFKGIFFFLAWWGCQNTTWILSVSTRKMVSCSLCSKKLAFCLVTACEVYGDLKLCLTICKTQGKMLIKDSRSSGSPAVLRLINMFFHLHPYRAELVCTFSFSCHIVASKFHCVARAPSAHVPHVTT